MNPQNKGSYFHNKLIISGPKILWVIYANCFLYNLFFICVDLIMNKSIGILIYYRYPPHCLKIKLAKKIVEEFPSLKSTMPGQQTHVRHIHNCNGNFSKRSLVQYGINLVLLISINISFTFLKNLFLNLIICLIRQIYQVLNTLLF